ncbi:MAG TPA: glycosyltransferase family 4 protein [Thermoleophilia bacterium]|nr:glycosyltransferase family 4 protein [Thermoleophilia bacterium]
MHILYLSHYFVPENNAPAARVHAMAREWVREGHQVTVLTGAPNVPAGVVYDGYRNGLWQDEWIDGIHTIRVWTYLAPNAGTVRRTVNFVSYFVSASVAAAFVRRPDVVIATSPQFFAGWAGVPAHWAHRAPFVLEVRDLWPESITAVGAMDRGLAVRALEVMERTLYAAADHIVTVGDGYREQLMARGVPAAKIDVVTNGVDTELFYPRDPDPAVRARYGVARDAFVVVFAGTIGMASGLDVVLRAARRLRARDRTDIVFLLVGDGAVRAELEATARTEGLDNVVFTGMVPRAQLPDVLAASDACLVHFKRREIFTTILPSKLFEDAAMAKPILLGFEGHAAALVRTADCGLIFTPEDDEALAAAAERLADDPAEARRLGENGRRHVLAHFDRRRLARDYLAVLERVRDEQRRPS